MAFKLLAFAALIAAARASGILAAPLTYIAPTGYAYPAPSYSWNTAPLRKSLVTKTADSHYDHHPQYAFAYGVQDPLTGDNKEHHEARNGDLVQGGYSLIEADGSRRIVEYTADGASGFKASVRKEGTIAKTLPVPHLITKVVPPLAYLPPQSKFVYTAAPGHVVKYIPSVQLPPQYGYATKYIAPLYPSTYAYSLPATSYSYSKSTIHH